MPRGIYSGDAIENAPIPTMIYHVPNQGTCIATSDDPDLIHWTPLPANPVIPIPDEPQEYIVFDPCAWYENGTYYALIGNKNSRPGYEGDATSLFRSNDCIHWEYRGPFYKSSRRWTDAVEDCACPDFFPLGDKYMLLMHGHRPYGMAHYYLGRYEDEQFYPEIHGRMNWQGGQLSGPETLLDDKGRRIFFGWIREARPWEKYGWASVMTLPRILSLSEGGSLRIEPVPELEKLRTKHYHQETVQLKANTELNIEEVNGDCLELKVEIDLGGATALGVKVRRSPDSEEETEIVYSPTDEQLKINLTKSTLDDEVKYQRLTPQDEDRSERYTNAQIAPFKLAEEEPLKLHIFLDKSVLEVFVNSRLCLTQRIYPTRADSLGVSIFARGGEAALNSLDAWIVTPTVA
jgi:sucrose-6-phosphate hydrolase SacC (GH32 family)